MLLVGRTEAFLSLALINIPLWRLGVCPVQYLDAFTGVEPVGEHVGGVVSPVMPAHVSVPLLMDWLLVEWTRITVTWSPVPAVRVPVRAPVSRGLSSTSLLVVSAPIPIVVAPAYASTTVAVLVVVAASASASAAVAILIFGAALVRAIVP